MTSAWAALSSAKTSRLSVLPDYSMSLRRRRGRGLHHYTEHMFDSQVHDPSYPQTVRPPPVTLRGFFHRANPDYSVWHRRGSRIEVRGVEIGRFEDGKIVERWGSTDELGIMQLLGASPN